jgi:outer membrane protein assembly factor BamE (lipoprotein component of BamABCDE complex)
MSPRPRAVLIALLAATLMTACQPTVSRHGYRLDQSAISRVVPGVTSREEVYRLLGSPSTVATFDNSRWYYVSQTTEQKTWYQRRITAQDVVAIDFDDQGIVREIGVADLTMAQAVQPDPETTRTLGNELTVFQQVIGNIGRFNPGQNPPGPRR